MRIPESLLEETGISGEVEISAADGTLVIRPAKKPREGWAEAYRAMEECDDGQIGAGTSNMNHFDDVEWEWT